MSGQFLSGNRLPPARELAKRIGVSKYPVQAAIAQLNSQGIVNSVRGSGVYIVKDAYAKITGDFSVKKNVAILSMFCLYDGGIAVEHGSTAMGLLKECEDVSIRPFPFSPFVDLSNSKAVVKEIQDSHFDGVLWFYPTKKHLSSVQAIAKAGIPIVVTSHSSFELALPAVEENVFSMAKKVKKHLKKSGCEKIVYFLFPTFDVLMENVSLVYNDEFEIETVHITYSGDYYRKKLFDTLTSFEPGCAVFLSNNRDLRAFYSDSPDELVELLDRHKVVISTDESVYAGLMPLYKRINPIVILHRFQTIGKLAAQKLSVVLDGKLENTTTLVPLELIDKFDD
jgi:hypothetical protein